VTGQGLTWTIPYECHKKHFSEKWYTCGMEQATAIISKVWNYVLFSTVPLNCFTTLPVLHTVQPLITIFYMIQLSYDPLMLKKKKV
jgi:hypothetical protein